MIVFLFCLSLFIWEATSKPIFPEPRNIQDILSDHLNQTFDPCENFYDFACGKRTASYSDPKDRRKDRRRALEKIDELILSINASNFKQVPIHKKQLRKFYDQCSEFKSLDSMERHKAIYDAAASRIGSENEISKDINLTESWSILGRMTRSVHDTMIHWGYAPKSSVKLFVNIWSFGKQISAFLQAPKFESNSSNDSIVRAIALCKDLFDNLRESKDLQGQLESFGIHGLDIRLDDVSHLIPSFHWMAYAESALPSELRGQEIVFIADANELSRLERMGEVLGRHSVDALSTWMLRTLQITHSRFQCNSHAADVFPLSIGSMILSEMKSDHLRLIDEVTEMWRAIKSSFDLFLNAVTWLTAAEKSKIRSKLDRIAFNAGVPRWIANDSELARRGYTYDDTVSYIENYFRALTYRHDFALRRITGDAPTSEYTDIRWDHPSFMSNAFYNPGWLLEHHYIQPLAFRFGYIGSILGHELGHGFDSERLPSHLTNSSTKTSDTQYQCIIKHYSQYCKPDLSFCMKARNTLKEDVCDIIGLKVSYTAYKFMRQLVNDDSSMTVNGETYSSDQVFFMGFAYNYCDQHWADIRNLSEETTHTLRVVRAEASVKQDRAFARAFGCPAGSKYSPLENCKLWGDASNLL